MTNQEVIEKKIVCLFHKHMTKKPVKVIVALQLVAMGVAKMNAI